MHDAFYLCDVARDPEGRVSGLVVSHQWAARAEWSPEGPPGVDGTLLAAAARCLEDGAPREHEHHAAALGRWFCIHLLPHDGRIGLLYEDITERLADRERLRAAAETQAFLLGLSDALRPLADPEAIQQTAARLLAGRLQANRVGYAEDRGDGETVTIGCHHCDGLAPIDGVFRYRDFGSDVHEAFHAGRTVVCRDTRGDETLSASVRAAHARLGIGAMLDVPLVKAGRLLAVFFVHLTRTHDWTAAEVSLVEEVAERTWAATERARADAARRTSEARYRMLFDSIDEGFCVIELLFDGETAYDYRYLEVNRAFAAHTGLVDAVGRTVRELVPDHEQHWFDTYARILRTGAPERFVLEAQGVGGRWFDVYAFRVDDPRLHRVAALFKDITEQRRTEAALLEADRRKDEFLAVLAHELRNPLAPVTTGLAVLRRAGDDAELAERTRGMMERQLSHMVRLIDDLMDASRIARGKLQLRREHASVADALRNALETTAPLIQASGHRLETDIAVEPLVVDGDPVRLAQVFANLINNAARYTLPGGRLRVTARVEGEHVRVDVEDDGVGIAAELLDRVFEPFTQFAPPGLAAGGLGVGLALARSLVELHGGTVVADSRGPGLGSRFTVRLPRVAAPARVEAGAPVIAGPSRRVLVVDDNHDAAEALALLLGLLGHQVRLAHDGPAALEAAEAQVPDVVLLDLGLPGMDGFEVARQLRTRAALRQARIVALSGYGQASDRQRSKEAGFDHHLVKPADVDALAAAIAGGGSEMPTRPLSPAADSSIRLG
jgi:PAS domain S-box-containing protein